MERTFHQILSSLLDENAASEPLTQTKISPAAGTFTPDLSLSWPLTQPTRPPRTAARKHNWTRVYEAAPRTNPSRAHPLTPLARLSADDRKEVQILIELGAPELKEGISLAVLKKAYRRLAKHLHPDTHARSLNEQERRERGQGFLRLQKAYRRLERSLGAITFNGVCGNESASESACPRRDAA